MESQELFYRDDTLDFTSHNKTITIKNSLNPWTEHQLINPYMNMKYNKSTKQLKKHQRKKIMSLDQAKSAKNLITFITKQPTQPNKVSKQLPKLNIGHLIKQNNKKKKSPTNFIYNANTSRQYLLNPSPMYFSSPTLKKINQLNKSTDLSKRSKLLPSVSRELNITRKIYLLQNKLNNINTPSPIKRVFRQEYDNRKDNDIRKLVQKQWSKKY